MHACNLKTFDEEGSASAAGVQAARGWRFKKTGLVGDKFLQAIFHKPLRHNEEGGEFA